MSGLSNFDSSGLGAVKPITEERLWDATRALTAHLKRETDSGDVRDVSVADARELLGALNIDPGRLRGHVVTVVSKEKAVKPLSTTKRPSSLDVSCPECDESPGRHCVTRNGLQAAKPHLGRIRKWKEQR